ncbi:Receptor-binding cancer antigen expressed on SiSo cells [Turdus rufiventris]|nr:Receptor-binding cancer antigen expressed on SiSo cells [Turdus rufiventris]
MNKDAQMRAAINQKLIETGERERLKELLRAKLIECGWKDQLKAHCKDVIKEKGLEHVTFDDLVAEITPKGRDIVSIAHSERSGRGRKLSGDQITLPTTVDYSSVPKQPEVEDWSSWDEDAPTSVKIEGGNGNVAAQQNSLEQVEPDYFKDMTPTIRKTQKIVIKKREPLNFGIPEGNTGFSSRLAATQDIPFIHQSPELGDLDTWQENTNAWEEEEDAAWQAEEVLRGMEGKEMQIEFKLIIHNDLNRQQKIAEREKRAAEQQRKKMEKEAQRLMKKEQNKIGVKLS